jgi:DNA-binding MarR family transcriptional regulator
VQEHDRPGAVRPPPLRDPPQRLPVDGRRQTVRLRDGGGDGLVVEKAVDGSGAAVEDAPREEGADSGERLEAARQRSTFDPPGGGLGYALMQAASAWRAELGDALAPLSVTPPQFFLLAALLHAHGRKRPGLTQRELAERTGIDVNTVSQVLRGLEGRGLVQRDRHPRDSRALALALTEAGLDLARACARQARALNRRYFAAVEPEPLLTALEKLTVESRRRRR